MIDIVFLLIIFLCPMIIGAVVVIVAMYMASKDESDI
jgi:hypothetical protein